MTTEIVLASSNVGKVRELSRLLCEPRIALVSMKDLVPPGFEVAEDGRTFEENAWKKALEVCEVTGLPALADDSGIEVDALGGRPGVHSARYAGVGAGDDENNRQLLRELDGTPMEGRTARFRCVLAFAAPAGEGARKVALSSGAMEGRILTSARGDNGFGYDPLFEPVRWPGRTTAEITPDEKNEISHRAAAARAMLPWLTRWLENPDRVAL